MQIVHVSHSYYPAIGGAESRIQGITERLAERGHDISVITTNADRSEAFVDPTLPLLPPGRSDVNGIPVARYPISHAFRGPLTWLMERSWNRRWPYNDRLRVIWNGPNSRSLAKAVARVRADVVGAICFPFRTMYYALKAKQIGGCGLIYYPCIHPDDLWAFDRDIMFKTLAEADAVIIQTEYARDYLIARYVPAERIHIVGAPVDPAQFDGAEGARFRNEFAIPAEAPIVSFLARKIEPKGIAHLVEAMKRVWNEMPDTRLVLAGGSTPYSKELMADLEVERQDLRRRIVNIDDFPPTLKGDLLDATDVLAVPSNVDSFGIAYLEAWLLGKPVIACRTGPCSSLIRDGREGLLVKYGDSVELAEAIKRLLKDPALRRTLGENGRGMTLAKYTWGTVMDQTEAIYAEVAAEAAKRK